MKITAVKCHVLLDPGYDTVGTHVNVYHLAATPVGMTVRFLSAVTSVDDRRVNFKVEAFDEAGQHGGLVHTRSDGADDAASLALDLLVRELGYRRGAVNPFLVGY